jgi:formylglycine-generating enzyme required for sulfatase activity
MKLFKSLILIAISIFFFSSCGSNNPTQPSNNGPTISAINPSKVLPNDNMTITGSNFGSERNDSKVYFNNLQVDSYVSWSDNEIKVIVPAITGSGSVKVVVNSNNSNEVAYSYDDGPRILSAGSGKAYIGDLIEIKGINFGNSQGSVTFNGTQATNITSWSSTSIKVTVPQNATTGNVVVKSSDGKTSNGFYFTISTINDPFINMIYPSNVYPGTEIKITGKNFGSSQGSSYVDFNGVKGSTYNLWTDDSIRVIVPATATTGLLRVFVGSQASNTVNIIVNQQNQPDPIVSSLSSNSFKIGETITIIGQNFGQFKTDSSSVSFNGVAAQNYLLWETTMIKVVVPDNATSGQLKVIIGKQSSNGVSYTINSAIQPPSITVITQTSAQSGQVIQILGKNFGSIKGDSYVLFGSTQAVNYTAWNDTEIQVEVPDMASGTVDVSVFVNNIQSNKVSFLIQQKAIAIVPTAEVPAGTFEMGCSDASGDCYPQHQVTLTKAILVGITEVTQAQYKKVMDLSNPSSIKDDANPVEQLTWYNAITFCNRLSKLEGYDSVYVINGNNVTFNPNANGWRLLTEAEWEYAARAGSQGKFGNLGGVEGSINKLGWTNANSKQMQHVKTLSPNDFGLYDMHGNAAEWVWDYYDFYTSDNQTNPTGPATGVERVFRGGGYVDGPDYCTVYSRAAMDPNNSQYYVGFRVCRNK